MKLILFAYFCLFITAQSAIGQNTKFYSDIQRYSLTFKMPIGFEEVPVIANNDLEYEYAIRNRSGTFEARYIIWPVDTSGKTKKEFGVDPNTVFSGMLEGMILTISGDVNGNSSSFDLADVRNQFNANLGRTAFVSVNSAFGKGYSYCTINVIHRDNVADVFIFYLFNDRTEIQKTMNRLDVYHALKFK